MIAQDSDGEEDNNDQKQLLVRTLHVIMMKRLPYQIFSIFFFFRRCSIL
jgi:hypothetical protein